MSDEPKIIVERRIIGPDGKVRIAGPDRKAHCHQRLVRRFVVTGHTFVPNKVRIEIEAESAEAAMKVANQRLKTGIQKYIVAGSEDEGAAFGFDATDAEEIKSPNDAALCQPAERDVDRKTNSEL